MLTRSDSHLYPIQNDANFFLTGCLEHGTQILVGVQFPNLVLVEFDAQGNYLRMISRAIPKQSLSVSSGFYRSGDYLLRALFECWQDLIGFVSATILVKRFFLEEHWIGIQDLPDYYQRFLDRPEDYDEDASREVQEELDRWRKKGDFVLCWGVDYFMSAEGEVIEM